MISVEVSVDDDILDAINETARAAPRRMRREVDRVLTGIRVDMLKELTKEPGPAVSPWPWDSEKQRRYVMMLIRQQGGPPRRRTSRLIRGWRLVFQAKGDAAGQLLAENPVPYTRFVQGDDARRGHLATGWPQYAPIVSKYRVRAEQDMIAAWYKVNEYVTRSGA